MDYPPSKYTIIRDGQPGKAPNQITVTIKKKTTRGI
jgi:hypothetical protein